MEERLSKLEEAVTKYINKSPSDKLWDYTLKACVPLVIAVATWLMSIDKRVSTNELMLNQWLKESLLDIKAGNLRIAQQLTELDRRLAAVEAKVK